jgi:RNA polymerase sigma-70 factor (ECF subfamily)
MNEEGDLRLSSQDARFRELYQSTLPDVYGFLSLRTAGNRSLAEDLTADTFAAAIAHFRAGKAAEVTLSWLRTVARRRLIDHWRRQSVASNKIASIADRTNPTSETEIGERDVVMRALATLSEAERSALVLQHVEGFPVNEVARIIGRTDKATESLLGRARAAFRDAYAEVGNG